LVFDPGSGLPLVHGAADQLMQVVTNLVANALNYTVAGRVSVSTRYIEDQVCLQVRDTGVGIAPGDMPHLFERFYRGRNVSRSIHPGTGLGLAIVKEIVDTHQGRIEVESQPGIGTTFSVYLPAVEADSP
jgi:signal transduction histidine kinase